MRNRTYLLLAAALAFGACKKADDSKKADDKKAEPDKKPAAQEDKPAAGDTKPAEPQTATDTKPAEPAPTPPPPGAEQPSGPAASETKVDGDTITLGFSPPTVGDKWTDENSTSMDMTVQAQGQELKIVATEHKTKAYEVLAVDGAVMSKAKVTYVTDDVSQTMNGKAKGEPSKIAGKTYTLEGSPPTVTTDAGPASADETKAVLDAEKHFAQVDPMDVVMNGKSFKKDQPTDFAPDELKKTFEGHEITPTKLTLTFKGMDGDNAKFEMSMDGVQSTKGGDMSLSLHGTVLVDIKRNEPVSMELDGSISMSGMATAQGTMKTTETRTR